MLFTARIQTIQGYLRHTIYQVHGKIDFGKPLEPNEVRAIPWCGEWTDVWSHDLEALQAHLAEYRQKAGLEPQANLSPLKPKKIKRFDRREALKKAAAIALSTD